jgi:hypothetical protein
VADEVEEAGRAADGVDLDGEAAPAFGWRGLEAG